MSFSFALGLQLNVLTSSIKGNEEVEKRQFYKWKSAEHEMFF